jgi:hypothetical protein
MAAGKVAATICSTAAPHQGVAEITNNSTKVIVYLGCDIENPHEQRFLTKLRRDLESRGVEATILANFVTHRSNQRQIDFLILTALRLTHAELKSLDPRAPLDGPANGFWYQQHPDGHRTTLDPNPYRQANDGTFAISDTVRTFARRLGLSDGERAIYRDIDTVVCIDPEIPDRSQLEPFKHVTAVGYDELLDRLDTPGRRPEWTAEQWEELILALNLYREDEVSPTARRRRSASETVSSYIGRYEASGAALHELVPVGFGTSPVGSAAELVGKLEPGRGFVLLGPSGSGKTHTARHLSVEAARRGAVVVWLRADEYDKGRFGHLLGRAVAPYTTATASELATAAYTAGAGLVVVVDGYNECRPQLRDELVEHIRAFALRHPCAVVVTTTVPVDIVGPETAVVTFRPPHPDERKALLGSYGAAMPERVSAAFTTAYELSVAATCESELDPDSSAADLFDAYVRRLCPAQVSRSGLRLLAAHMVDQLRNSMRLTEATALLASVAGAGLTPEQVDEVLSSRLLDIRQGHLSFSHELLGRFLAAEHLALNSETAQDLAASLARPHNRELRSFALSLERDSERRATAMALLADAQIYLAALEGDLGPDARELASAAVRGALADAAFVTAADWAHFTPIERFFARWDSAEAWSPAEQAQLRAAGWAAGMGMFLPEVFGLLDRTDPLVETAWTQGKAAGHDNPLSAAIMATYTQQGNTTQTGLAATILMDAFETAHPGGGWGMAHSGAGHGVAVAAAAYDGAGPRSWGRLYLACVCADVNVPSSDDGRPVGDGPGCLSYYIFVEASQDRASG